MNAKVKALLDALDDTNPEVRGAAAQSLGKIGTGAKVIQALAAMLTRQVEPARQSAAAALMVIKDKKAVDVILECLSHPSASVRFATVSAIVDYLSKPGGVSGWFNVELFRSELLIGASVEKIVDALVKLTRDPNPRVRQVAINALDIIRRRLKEVRFEMRKRSDIQDQMDGDDDGWGGPEMVRMMAAPPPPVERAASSAVEEATLNSPEPRYADLSLYKRDARSGSRNEVPAGRALRVGEPYVLEAAVRVSPTGIRFDGRKRRSLYEPRQQRDVTVWVTAEGDGFEIENPTQTLLLPPKGDSVKNALFTVTPTRKGGGDASPTIRVRLYYHFNLLEELTLSATVAGKFEDVELDPRAGPFSFAQNRLERKYVDFDNIEPRAMHVAVNKRGAHFQFVFTFYNSDLQTVEFTAPVLLRAEEIEDSLITIRKIFFDIAMSETFSRQFEGDEDEFVTNLRSLAQAGSALWTALFKRETRSPVFKIGEWLEAHPLGRDSIIQVSLGADAPDFIFPWGIIYDRPLPKENYQLPDPDGFWGIRYCIEQQLPNTARGTDEATRVENGLKVEVILWEHFRNLKQQMALMERLEKSSKAKLSISKPPLNNAEVVLNLLRECDAHILYFYTHGYTRHRQAAAEAGPDLSLFVQRYEALKPGSALRATLKPLYESIKREKFEPSRSWIEPTYGRLYLDELYLSVGPFLSEPLVILNMCESAQIIPSLSDSFIHFFLDRGAKGVIGTECPMTIEFAHPFSETFLTEILAGAQVGKALLNVRRHYMRLKNPLGLAYTLFGSATAHFRPPVLELPASGSAG